MSKRENENGMHNAKKTEKVNTKKNRKTYSGNQYESNNRSKQGINPKENLQQSKSNKKKKKKKMNKILKGILIVLITILIVFVTIFGMYIVKARGNLGLAIKNMLKDVVGDQDPIFVLVMGVSEDISVQLTDTIMLVGYNPDTNQAFVLSIPRDTFVGDNESKAGGFDKINALYQKDPNKTVEAVEKITGININYYVTIKTSVLVKIVDTIGGIEFDVPIDMNYDDPSQDLHIHLKAGLQKINGNQAEQLVRFRHNNNGSTYSASYGDNDEGRTRTQREFLKVVMEKVISIRDVDKIKSITKELFDNNNLETDITVDKVFGYIPYAMDFNTSNLQMEQLPGKTEILNSLWFFKADKEETKKLINNYIEKLGLTEDEKKLYLKSNSTEKTTIESKNTTSNSTKKSTSSNTTNKNTTSSNKKNTTTNKTTKAQKNSKNTVTNSTNTTNSTKKKDTNQTENSSTNISNTNKSEQENVNLSTENKNDNSTASGQDSEKNESDNKPISQGSTEESKSEGTASGSNTTNKN